MKNITSYQIANTQLYLNRLTLVDGAPAKPAPTSVNHIAVVDCSGSMYGELDKLRAGLKAKLPTLLREGDTLSLIWFSGRGQFGPILEAESVSSLRDLAKVNGAIDRWLRPQGLTGFKQPLQEAANMITRIRKLNKNPFALFFMSDGMDNQWPRSEILKVIEDYAGAYASSTFVEYGNYADRAMLTAMAERAGGQLVHCDSFGKFEPAFTQAVTKQIAGGMRKMADVPTGAIGGFVFEMVSGDQELITYDATSGKALVGADTRDVWWVSAQAAGSTIPPNNHDGVNAMYAAMSLFAIRMKPEIVFPLLKATGDVRFIKMFANCFGKQAYSTFMDETRRTAFDVKLQLLEGQNPGLVPPDDAFTVIDLLRRLSDDETTRLVLDDPSFEYSRISRATLDGDENLSAAEQKQVAELTAQISTTKSAAAIKGLQEKIDAILANKQPALKFEPEQVTDGYEISSLTFNEESPNVSVLITRQGTVDLASRKPPGKIPVVFETKTFRNYAIIAHGIVNVKTLPVDISKDLYRSLASSGVKLFDNERGITCIDLTTLPIINRKMVKSVQLKDAARIAWDLQVARAAQKVYKDYVKTKYPSEKLATFGALYGEEGAQWLKDNGITEYSGFNPPRVQAEATDFIMGKELLFKIKGYSTLPPVAKVAEKMTGKSPKLNGPETLMATAITEVESFLKNNPAKLHHDWLVGKEKMNQAHVRGLAHQLSQIVFSIIVGQTWFADCPTLDDNTVTIKPDAAGSRGAEVTVTAELREIEIKL